jgi:hypothetical protein
LICFLLLVVAVGLGVALVQSVRSNSGHQANASDATVLGLRTEVARYQQQVAVGQTAIARQQQTIAQLQKAATAQPTPSSDNGTRSYLAKFLDSSNKLTFVLYMDWTESNGFIKNGRLLTANDYQAKSERSFQFSGVDNSGSIGFTGTGAASAMTFTGTRNSDGTLTVSGLPWSVFAGIVGGTMPAQTLHQSDINLYNAAVASLAHQST